MDENKSGEQKPSIQDEARGNFLKHSSLLAGFAALPPSLVNAAESQWDEKGAAVLRQNGSNSAQPSTRFFLQIGKNSYSPLSFLPFINKIVKIF